MRPLRKLSSEKLREIYWHWQRERVLSARYHDLEGKKFADRRIKRIRRLLSNRGDALFTLSTRTT